MEQIEQLVERAMARHPSNDPAEDERSLLIAASMVVSASAHGASFDEAFLERAAQAVHDAWLARNRAHASDAELLPYELLSEEDKEKDRTFVRRVIDVAD